MTKQELLTSPSLDILRMHETIEAAKQLDIEDTDLYRHLLIARGAISRAYGVLHKEVEEREVWKQG